LVVFSTTEIMANSMEYKTKDGRAFFVKELTGSGEKQDTRARILSGNIERIKSNIVSKTW